jgi:hypothetical protein
LSFADFFFGFVSLFLVFNNNSPYFNHPLTLQLPQRRCLFFSALKSYCKSLLSNFPSAVVCSSLLWNKSLLSNFPSAIVCSSLLWKLKPCLRRSW